MSQWIVTVNLHRKMRHDPKHKQLGVCPIPGSQMRCTDITGEHHSFIVEANSITEAREKVNPSLWITRIEEVLA